MKAGLTLFPFGEATGYQFHMRFSARKRDGFPALRSTGSLPAIWTQEGPRLRLPGHCQSPSALSYQRREDPLEDQQSFDLLLPKVRQFVSAALDAARTCHRDSASSALLQSVPDEGKAAVLRVGLTDVDA